MEIELRNFTFTPTEKHVAIIEIKVWNKICLKFKVVAKKDGLGYFCAPASVKMPMDDGTEGYAPVWLFESNSDKEDIERFLRTHVNKHIEAAHKAGMALDVMTMPSVPLPKPQQAQQGQMPPSRPVAQEQDLPF